VILRILLDYYTDIRQWSTARVLSRECKQMVDTQPYNTHCWGRRSFIQPHICGICEKTSTRCTTVNYWSANFTSMLHIVCCPEWSCKMSAVHSALCHGKSNHMYTLRKPFRETRKILIPRSDGSTTQGFCKTRYLFRRNGEWCVYTYWVDDANEEWSKLVPLAHYTKDPPPILFA